MSHDPDPPGDDPDALALVTVGDTRVLLRPPPALDPATDAAAGELVVALLSGDLDGPPPIAAFALLSDAPEAVRDDVAALLPGAPLLIPRD